MSTREFWARMEEIELEVQHRAKWNSYCENCREPLEGGEVWIKRSGGSTDDGPEQTYYCPECVLVNAAR